MTNPTPHHLRLAYVIYAAALIVLALAHTVNAQTSNPYANPPDMSGWVQQNTPGGPECVKPYAAINVWLCPQGATTPVPPRFSLEDPHEFVPPTQPLPQPSSRTLMFGNVVTGRDNEAQDYAPFLNLANGWQPQAFLVTIVSGDAQWQHVYEVPAWRHRSINLRDVPILKDKTTGFGIFVQVWGVATATVSLHRASDPWGPAYQTIQPDAMSTPSVMTPER